MNRWNEISREHAIFKSIEELDSILKQIKSSPEKFNKEDVLEIRRLGKVLNRTISILNSTDFEITPIQILNDLESYLKNHGVFSYLNAYITNGDSVNLVNANDSLNPFLIMLNSIASMSLSKSDLTSIKKSELKIDDYIVSFSKRIKLLYNELDDIKSINTNLSTQTTELRAQYAARMNELDLLTNGWQSQFSDSQHKRDTDFNLSQSNHNKEITFTIKNAESNFRELLNNYKISTDLNIKEYQKDYSEQLQKLVDDSKAKHESILDLYNLVAGDSVAAQYSDNANTELKAANFWRWVTIAFVVLAVLWQAFSYTYLNSVNVIDNIVWAKLIKGFSITALLLFGAGYSAKQSGNHRQNEKKARWFAFEVKAIDPFIATLTNEQQKDLKNKLSERLFGQTNIQPEKDVDQIDVHSYDTIVKGMESLLKAIK